MKICIIGIGYVGSVSAAVLADLGNEVLVVDNDEAKVDAINRAESPINEPGLSALLSSGVRDRGIRASANLSDSLKGCEVVIVSVGTPSKPDSGEPDLEAITNVVIQISENLSMLAENPLIAISSTIPVGTTNGIIRQIFSDKGWSSSDYKMAFIPEFLRQGTAICDFRNPSRFVIGAETIADGEAFMNIRPDLAGSTHIVKVEVAEMLKTTENAWHATKVTFANEIGRLGDKLGIDSNEVMQLLVRDTKLNTSAAYLRPGFAFGGSCLPKEVNSLVFTANKLGEPIPMIAAIEQSNSIHLHSALQSILSTGLRKVLVLGLAFKAGTDDIRNSPSIELVRSIVEKGLEVKIHDFNDLGRALTSSKALHHELYSKIRVRLSTDLPSEIDGSTLVVVAQYNRGYIPFLSSLPNSQPVLNLVGLR